MYQVRRIARTEFVPIRNLRDAFEAITDVGGGVAKADGLDVPFLKHFLQEHGSIAGAPGTTLISNDEFDGRE